MELKFNDEPATDGERGYLATGLIIGCVVTTAIWVMGLILYTQL
jgi:hypothetical protein